jgi:hypothetical protein
VGRKTGNQNPVEKIGERHLRSWERVSVTWHRERLDIVRSLLLGEEDEPKAGID